VIIWSVIDVRGCSVITLNLCFYSEMKISMHRMKVSFAWLPLSVTQSHEGHLPICWQRCQQVFIKILQSLVVKRGALYAWMTCVLLVAGSYGVLMARTAYSTKTWTLSCALVTATTGFIKNACRQVLPQQHTSLRLLIYLI
jgi:hypothetical protein